jgi:hypothetical protein
MIDYGQGLGVKQILNGFSRTDYPTRVAKIFDARMALVSPK